MRKKIPTPLIDESKNEEDKESVPHLN